MDWRALELSVWIGVWTVAILAPVAILTARALSGARFPGKSLIEALIALPLVLPPTVLGYALLLGWSGDAPFARFWRSLTGSELAFSFEALVLASLIVNLPFAVQPVQRSYAAIGPDLLDAAKMCGMGPWRRFWRVEAPLIWPGALAASALVFAHTMGEFGVVFMVGGAVPGETKTAAIAIYDATQSFQDDVALALSLTLLAISLAAVAFAYAAVGRIDHGRR